MSLLASEHNLEPIHQRNSSCVRETNEVKATDINLNNRIQTRGNVIIGYSFSKFIICIGLDQEFPSKKKCSAVRFKGGWIWMSGGFINRKDCLSAAFFIFSTIIFRRLPAYLIILSPTGRSMYGYSKECSLLLSQNQEFPKS